MGSNFAMRRVEEFNYLSSFLACKDCKRLTCCNGIVNGKPRFESRAQHKKNCPFVVMCKQLNYIRMRELFITSRDYRRHEYHREATDEPTLLFEWDEFLPLWATATNGDRSAQRVVHFLLQLENIYRFAIPTYVPIQHPGDINQFALGYKCCVCLNHRCAQYLHCCVSTHYSSITDRDEFHLLDFYPVHS